MSSARARAHSAPARRRRGTTPATSSPTPMAVLIAEPDDRAPQLGVVAAGEEEQRDVGGPHARRRRARTSARGRRTPRARTARRRAAPPSQRTSRAGPRPPRDRRRSSARRSRPSAHHRTPSTSRPLPSPSHVGSSAISAVHCVRARTKTRSKNSSSGVTRSPSRRTAPRRRRGPVEVTMGRSSHAVEPGRRGRALPAGGGGGGQRAAVGADALAVELVHGVDERALVVEVDRDAGSAASSRSRSAHRSARGRGDALAGRAGWRAGAAGRGRPSG